ncbi:hypothetical protein [Rhizobium sp. SG570]|uniref:hypothetical protein n=1 Tax=Rhizobium sp. SG570 TaxID=2587113 RepID=UPI0014468D00|nr:hypothetical protein [Rhizobium sp. SG570]NKJ34140.1 hypothetical protein [Rhizobium sp. SG570]
MTDNQLLFAEASAAAAGNVDEADPRRVLLAVLGCAATWVAEARIIGNVRAGDISRAISSVLHTDYSAVDRFANAMKAKLAKKRAEGYGGWDDPDECTIEHLSKLLIRHALKGDPIDVANFAMMIHQRGAAITAGESAEPRAAWYEDSTGCFHMSLDVALIEGNARDNGHEIGYLYGDPVAPLAEADADTRPRYSMKRMRDEIAKSAERERLRFEGDLDKWMKAIGAGITGYQPEAYALMDMACAELVTLRAKVDELQTEVFVKQTEASGYLKAVEQLQHRISERDDDSVGIGMAIAAAIIMRVWGHDTEAREIISAAALTTEARLREIGVEDYDLDALRPILDETRSTLQQGDSA